MTETVVGYRLLEPDWTVAEKMGRAFVNRNSRRMELYEKATASDQQLTLNEAHPRRARGGALS